MPGTKPTHAGNNLRLRELIFARIYAGPVFACVRIQEHVWGVIFRMLRQILRGISCVSNTCRACIRTNIETFIWRIIYGLSSCRGALLSFFFVPTFRFFLLCPRSGFWYHRSLGQKSCRTKVSRIFRFFVPNFAPNFAPNFPRIFWGVFVLHFVGDGDQKKFTKNPRHFAM